MDNKIHCSSFSRTEFQEWLQFEVDMKTLCGVPIADAGPAYFANMFTEQAALCSELDKDGVICEKCLNHPDLPLLVLSFMNDD